MAKKTYTLTLKPLTGVHIGTGEELTPLDYKLIRSSSKTASGTIVKIMYWKYSSDKILRRLITEKKELSPFEAASVTGNMGELQAFFQKNCTIDDIDYLCDITEEFKQVYQHNRAKDPYDNAARVLPMYRPAGSMRPVIPGSSIKGSIRTAVLNMRLDDLEDAEYKAIPKNIQDDELQRKLLRYDDAKNDPFRCISIGDAVFSAKDTQLVGLLKNISRNKEGDSLFSLDKMQIQAEVLRGELLEGAASADTSMAVDRDLQDLPFSVKYGQPPSRISGISMQNILESCNSFYWDEFKSEYKNFYKNVVDGTTDIIEELKKKLETALSEKDRFIIRLGRWSQVEFVTFNENFRKPDTKRKGSAVGAGNTRTLFSYHEKFVPMGWCVITIKESV
jgi:CRISPR-associated protein Csm5